MATTDNATISAVAHADAERIEAERKAPSASAPITVSGQITAGHKTIDLDSVGAVEAKTLMSAEHKALGYRPPPGSLAAEAAAAAAKHPQAHLDIDANILREAAREDAARIAAGRKNGDTTTSKAVEAHATIDFDLVGEAEAKTIMSAEHKALGYRPPPGSLAAEAQAAAAKHPHPDGHLDPDVLREAAREDAARITSERDPNVAPTLGASIDLASVGVSDAAAIESAEHKALGYRPPPTSLAAAAKAAAAEHPDASAGVRLADLQAAARDDALRVQEKRGEVKSDSADAAVDISSMTQDEARKLQSEEQKILGYRPPSDSVAAQAQAAVADKAS